MLENIELNTVYSVKAEIKSDILALHYNFKPASAMQNNSAELNINENSGEAQMKFYLDNDTKEQVTVDLSGSLMPNPTAERILIYDKSMKSFKLLNISKSIIGLKHKRNEKTPPENSSKAIKKSLKKVLNFKNKA